MQKKQWSQGKRLYVALSILLSIQVFPFLGTAINLLFLLGIAGLVLSIILLIVAEREHMSRNGAVLALITFIMAIISGMFSWALLDGVDDGTVIIILLWMFVNWLVCIAAVTVCYITAFSTKQKPLNDPQVQPIANPVQVKPLNPSEVVKVGFGGNISLTEVKLHNEAEPKVVETIEPIAVQTSPDIPLIQKVETKSQPAENPVQKDEDSAGYVTQVMGRQLDEIVRINEEKDQQVINISADELDN